MLEKFALKLFGSLTEPYLGNLDSLKTNMKKAGMKTGLHEYISLIILATLITLIVSITVSSVMVSLLLANSREIVYSYTFAIILSFLMSGVAFFVGYYYPSTLASAKKGKIEKALPFAVFYMTTTASSGVNTVEIFKMLSLKGGVIGEEATKIYSDVKTLGMNLSSALQKAALRTPSPMFSDLLWGMVSIMTTGGDMENYLSGKARLFMSHYRRSLEEYSKSITLYTEIYITLIIVGSLLFIILIAIMSPLMGGATGFGSGTLMLQTFIVFFFMPLISVAFIVILKAVSPSE